MNHSRLLKISLLLALTIVFSGRVSASEVTGTLSSGGQGGSMSGMVTSIPSYDTSPPNNNATLYNSGSVLGESTVTSENSVETNHAPAVNSEFNRDIAEPDSLVNKAPNLASSQVATALSGVNSFSPSTWFWTFVLAVILIGLITIVSRRIL